MTQQWPHLLALVLLGVGILSLVAFIAQHFMAPLRPSWHEDPAWLWLASLAASRLVLGHARRRAMQKPD
jgi:Tfp pilus assembly protein PilV